MICKKCNEDKPAEEFGFSNGYIRHTCNQCRLEATSIYMKTTRKDQVYARKAMKKINRKESRDFGAMTIEDITIEARAHGMSYGKYVAKRSQGLI